MRDRLYQSILAAKQHYAELDLESEEAFKLKTLIEQPHLMESFKALVAGGAISEEEFWEKHPEVTKFIKRENEVK